MVRPLPEPNRPLTGGTPWTWRWDEPTPQRPWGWCRIYHVSEHTPDGLTHRDYGPLVRFDPHVPGADGKPTTADPRRSVLYVADTLDTAIGEVFGDLYPTASICPGYRVALLRPINPLTLVDLASPGAAMRLGALPALVSTPGPRQPTQRWARAIYEDNPLPGGAPSNGIRYRTANADGHALALWDTDSQVAVVRNEHGVTQDFGLIQELWPQVLGAAARLGMHAETVPSCTRCQPPPDGSKERFSAADALAAVRAYVAERAQAGVMMADAFVDGIELDEGVLTATWSQDAVGKDKSDLLLELNPFENLAQFIGVPMAFDDQAGARIRQHVHTIYVVLPTAVGSLPVDEIHARATGRM